MKPFTLLRKKNAITGAGTDLERSLTGAQPKSRGCGYMGVVLSMGSYKHDLADAAPLSA